VSVVIAVHNGEEFLAEAVESVLAQSLADLELVVVDDGSTDATAAILERWASQDARVRVYRQPHAGRAMARNHAFEIARAALVAVLDADDVALPTRLEQQLAFMNEHPEVAVVGGAVVFIGNDGRMFGEWRYPVTDAEMRLELVKSTPLAHSTVMIRKAPFMNVGGYRAQFAFAQDVDLWLRLADRHAFANLPEPLIRYRVHPDQGSVRNCEQQALCNLAAHVASRARGEGRRDPIDELSRIDSDSMLKLGIRRDELTAAIVRNMTWVARTLGRAGYPRESDSLFREAHIRARSLGPSSTLSADVHRDHARLHRERGRRMLFALETARAARDDVAARPAQLAERLGG
jgi:glycosyltransferase involved in cell wall biosynthesis